MRSRRCGEPGAILLTPDRETFARLHVRSRLAHPVTRDLIDEIDALRAQVRKLNRLRRRRRRATPHGVH